MGSVSQSRIDGLSSRASPTPLGVKFGRLTVTGELYPKLNKCGKKQRIVTAICDCGLEKSYQLNNLKSGNSYSCGCYDLEMLELRNKELSRPQLWTVDGDTASIEIDGVKVIVDADDVAVVGKYRWYIDGAGYVDSMQCDSMHRLLLGLKKGDRREGDHINHIRSDNRRSQIRVATSSQNKMNTRGGAKRKSKFKGVIKHRRKWVAQLKKTDGEHFRESFDTEIEAAIAYDTAAKRIFGEFAFLNFHSNIESHANE